MLVNKMSNQEKARTRSNGSSRRSQSKNTILPSKNGCQKMSFSKDNTRRDDRRKSPSALRLRQIKMLMLILAIIHLPLVVYCQTTANTTSTDGSLETTSTESVIKLESNWFSEEPTSVSNNNNINKIKPVNFTLVDETFDAALGNDEVVQRWRNMDLHLQDGMKSALKMVFPLIVSISQEAKVSSDCSGGILKWILSLRNMRSWAIKMLDATGKPTSGILQGSLTMFGNYRQCLSVRAPDEDEIEITNQFEEYFRGQFCVLHLKPWMPAKPLYYHLNSSIEFLLRSNYQDYEKTLYDELAELAFAFNFVDIRMDLCVPSTCTVADIQRVAELLSKKLEMRAKVMRCDIASRDTNRFQYLDATSCYWITVPICLALVSLLSSMIAPLMARRRSGRGRVAAEILKSLSFIEALRNRLRMPDQTTGPIGEDLEGQDCIWTSSNPVAINNSKPLALYGLRSLLVFWFIIVQMTVELNYQYLRESLSLRNLIISYWPFQVIINSVLLFDSIIFITAFTYSYTCLESTIKSLTIYIMGKYIRLILPIITMIALMVVTPILAIESPVWRNFVEDQSAVCKSNGYLNLFFLQNFISYDRICLPHTWLFCVELQLILLSIPLILLFEKSFLKTEDSVIINLNSIEEEEKNFNRKVCLLKLSISHLIRTKAGLLSAVFLVSGVLTNFFIVYAKQLPPSWFYTFPDVQQRNYYFGVYVTKAWTHLSVFLIGFLAGYLCRVTSQLRLLREGLPSGESDSQISQQQSSPLSTDSTGGQSSELTLQQSYKSTSTIMTMEIGGQSTDDSSASESHSNDGKSKKNHVNLTESIMRRSLHIVAIACMSAIIFSTHNWSTQRAPSTFVAAIYDATSRLIWSLSLGWLTIQVCLPNKETNKYSSVTKALSHPICISLGRLSFLAYLIAPYVNNFVLAVQEQSLFPSLFMLFHVIVGNIVITYATAFILAILIEQPLRRLFSCLVMGRRFRKRHGSVSIIASSINK